MMVFYVCVPISVGLLIPLQVRRVIFCCGRVYYDLDKARTDTKAFDVAIIRVEQICPFPYDSIGKISLL